MATLYAFGAPGDPHIAAVLGYVRKLGVEAVPVASWSADPGAFQPLSWRSDGAWSIGKDTAFWLRDKHQVGGITTTDKQLEWWSHFNTSAMIRAAAALSPLQFNRTQSLAGMNAKIPQLTTAAQAGFTVPETIVSNRKADILEFIEAHGACIVKPLAGANAPPVGSELATSRYLPTVNVSAADVMTSDEASFLVAPSIFQRKVEKAYELRTVVFRDEIVSFRIDSQDHPYTELDWRAGELLLDCDVVETPEELVKPIARFLELSGLDTTVFDFAVRPDGSAVFFESNPEGQWRRMDRLNDDVVSRMFARQMVKAIHAVF
jgi:glutathione synthase/RimK-type ligase-like ATP-grasp enzyme